jgi:hypothetical protein
LPNAGSGSAAECSRALTNKSSRSQRGGRRAPPRQRLAHKRVSEWTGGVELRDSWRAGRVAQAGPTAKRSEGATSPPLELWGG